MGMDFKAELGQRIQTLREEKGLSRQAVCGIEDILTTRQLQRIEKGQSLPTIATAMYIAAQLEVSLDSLANNESLELPEGYVTLKYRLNKLFHYGNEERLQQREAIIEEIYEKYFDNLPEEEQIAIQVQQASLDMINTNDINYDQGLLEEYLHQVILKEQLTLNDIEILNLRLLSLGLKNFNKEEFIDLLSKVLLAASYFPFNDLEAIQSTIISAAGILSHYEEYDLLPDILEVLEEVMSKRNDFQDKIFSYALQWKIALFIKHNYREAEENYRRVNMLIDLLTEDVLKENMQLDWEQDQIRFKQRQ